jgi:hypothetical protein
MNAVLMLAALACYAQVRRMVSICLFGDAASKSDYNL